jgi:transposase
VKLANGKVRQVEVSWADAGSGFTLLFEDEVVLLLQGMMSKFSVATKLRIGPKVVDRVVGSRVSQALCEQGLSDVRQLGVDETSRAKGHTYFTVLTDREAKKVVGLSLGKDSDAVGHAMIDMEIRGADRQKVKVVTSDLSPAYIKAQRELLPKADLVFDRFHLAQLMGKAVDKVRRREQTKQAINLKKTRYLWLKSENKLTDEQREKVAMLGEEYEDLGEIYRHKHLFKGLLDDAVNNRRVMPLKSWIKEAKSSHIPELAKVGKSLTRHWFGIKTYFKWLNSNGYAERVNLTIQNIKRIAKGYRNSQNFIHMIYFHLGGLNLLTHTKR